MLRWTWARPAVHHGHGQGLHVEDGGKRSAAALSVLPRVFSFGELLDDLLVKFRKVGRSAAGHQPLVYHHRTVLPLRAGVDEIFSDVMYRGHSAARHYFCINQHLRTMAYRRDRLARLKKGFDKRQRLLIYPQFVRIDYASW